MIKSDINKLELNEFIADGDPKQHCRATFPMAAALGSKNTTMVYFELEPGDSLGRHTDSEEEILLCLGGNVRVEVGDEKGELSAGQFALVPTMVPHNLTNIGGEKARVLGFFGSPNIVATFDKAWLPEKSRIVDTEKLFQQMPVG